MSADTPAETDGGSTPEGPITVTIGPRAFGATRDWLTLGGLLLALAMCLMVWRRVGLPGLIGTVYVLTASAVWVQGFRRCWRISDDRIEARRWVRWKVVDRNQVSEIVASSDEMGVRAVMLSASGQPLEIPADDMRIEPLLAAALAGFVDECQRDGAAVDPTVPAVLRG